MALRAWSHSRLVFPLGPRARYPLSKYALLRARVIADGTLGREQVAEPQALPWSAVARTHDPAFVQRIRTGAWTRREQAVVGIPYSELLVTRTRHGLQGTLDAARDALAGGYGVMLGGGTHHAGRATARGYCLFNDVAVATTELRRAGALRRVLAVDCDVHHGDGTAALWRDDAEAFSLSLHEAHRGPGGQGRRPASDLDVDLPAGTGDDDYLAALDAALAQAVPRAAPELLFYVAGADPWEGDALGSLELTKAGLRARDELVLAHAAAHGVPVVVTLAGGYAPDVCDTVDIHAATIAATARAAAHRTPRA